VRLVSFSIPYYLDGTALVKGRPCKSWVMLAKAKIAVLTQQVRLQRAVSIANRPTSGCRSYQQALATGNWCSIRISADASVLSGWVQEYLSTTFVDNAARADPLCVVMPKVTVRSPAAAA